MLRTIKSFHQVTQEKTNYVIPCRITHCDSKPVLYLSFQKSLVLEEFVKIQLNWNKCLILVKPEELVEWPILN